MKVNLAVSGRFHFHNYVRYLARQGALHRFYYSHRLSTDSLALDVPRPLLVNVWIKEYLLHLHSRVLHGVGVEAMKPFYRELWQEWVLRAWERCDLLHLMLHGGGRRIIRRAQEQGSLVVGEPVNAHPEVQAAILEEEYARLGIRGSAQRFSAASRIVEEAEAADLLLTASEFVKQSFVSKGFSPKKIGLLPYGVDLSRFSPAMADGPQPHRPFRIICVGGINIRKGQVDLLEACRRLRMKSAELLLVGRVHPEMLPVLRRYVGTFRHLSHVPNQELRRYYAESSVFVLPTLEDGFAVVLTEAMACGLPVITTTNAGAAEHVVDGVTGYVVPIRDPDAIAERIQRLHDDPGLRIAMGRASRERVTTAWDWRGYASRLIGIYENLLESASAKAVA